MNEYIQFFKTVRDREQVTALGKQFQRAVMCGKKRIMKIISMRIKIHKTMCVTKKKDQKN